MAKWEDAGQGRPLSVSFQFRASGKETDVATPLGLEKYGKVDFTLGKLTKRHPKNGQKEEDICQGSLGTGRNFFLFTIEGVGVIFLQVLGGLY